MVAVAAMVDGIGDGNDDDDALGRIFCTARRIKTQPEGGLKGRDTDIEKKMSVLNVRVLLRHPMVNCYHVTRYTDINTFLCPCP
jgi:hypothetical protein